MFSPSSCRPSDPRGRATCWALTHIAKLQPTGRKNGQREGEIGPEDLLAKRKGYVVADATGVFDASFKRPSLIECGCNMHSRRYFRKALGAGSWPRGPDIPEDEWSRAPTPECSRVPAPSEPFRAVWPRVILATLILLALLLATYGLG